MTKAFYQNKICLIWLFCGLIRSGWIVFMMMYCMNFEKELIEEYKSENGE